MSTSKIDYAADLPDNEHDQQRLKPEETIIDMPDVSDIPGQENIVPAPLGEMADTTISSADEEGEGLWNNEEDDELNSDFDISTGEKRILDNAGTAIPDDENLEKATLDSKDEEGDKLNEDCFDEDLSGSDLDLPGTELDDKNELLGEEDEENNDYSLGDDEGGR